MPPMLPADIMTLRIYRDPPLRLRHAAPV